MKHALFFVLYDGIENSVFEGQIAQRLMQKKVLEPDLDIHIISYENRIPFTNPIIQKLSITNIQVHIFKKRSFIFLSIYPLKALLQQFYTYSLIARGPLAGFVCLKAMNTNRCTHLTIQARGLLAEEYKYIHRNNSYWVLRVIHSLRALYLQRLEKYVYKSNALQIKNHDPSMRNCSHSSSIEAVSLALKEYIVSHYGTLPCSIALAYEDIPQKISPLIVQEWRAIIRRELAIPSDAYVYCYNGSYKSWQCSPEIISFFKHKQETNNTSFLLLISQDKNEFLKEIRLNLISPTHYRLITVSHKEIYHYLAAADAGILFREKHIINWVSRPTKLLEYYAVGLTIIHNNTVAYAQRQSE